VKDFTTAGYAIMTRRIMNWTGKLYKELNVSSVAAVKV